MKKLLLLLTILIGQLAWSQHIEVSGIVTDETGIPLPGTSIHIKGTSKGTTTDFDGNYKILAEKEQTLVFSYVGYTSQEIKITKSVINVQLKQGEALECVTIVGYGGAVHSTKVASAISTVEGRAAGVRVERSIRPRLIAGELKKSTVEKLIVNDPSITHSQLTAGEINDIKEWDEWKATINNDQYQKFQEKWNFFLQRKILVNVKSEDGKPMNNIKVSLYTDDNKKIMSVKTDAKGSAWMFLDFNKITDNDFYRVQIEAEGKIKGKKIRKEMNEIDFVLNAGKSSNSIDIMFTIDATGSMSDEINYLKAELENIMDRVAADENIDEKRVALTFYRDEGDEYVVKEYDFETNIPRVQKSLNENNADGGGDYEEALEVALKKANELAWNEKARSRLMFLLLDAPPHFTKDIMNSIQQQIRKAQEKGIKIIPVVASGANKNVEFLMRFFSISTNGTYVFLTDDSGIGNEHLKPSKETYTVEKLNDLIVRLIKQSVKTNA